MNMVQSSETVAINLIHFYQFQGYDCQIYSKKSSRMYYIKFKKKDPKEQFYQVFLILKIVAYIYLLCRI